MKFYITTYLSTQNFRKQQFHVGVLASYLHTVLNIDIDIAIICKYRSDIVSKLKKRSRNITSVSCRFVATHTTDDTKAERRMNYNGFQVNYAHYIYIYCCCAGAGDDSILLVARNRPYTVCRKMVWCNMSSVGLALLKLIFLVHLVHLETKNVVVQIFRPLWIPLFAP